MKQDVALIIPAAGRGSRFTKQGITNPKPLIDLHGKPFFWWATQSVLRSVTVRQLIFVVLREHIDTFQIDQRIHQYYPDATIVELPEVTQGAAQTAQMGLQGLISDGPVAFNDCDHAFICNGLPQAIQSLQDHRHAASLMCFRSSNPAYSYAKLDEQGQVVGTIEKEVASPFAIAGCYLFGSASRFQSYYERYERECAYKELFLSGVYNLLIEEEHSVGKVDIDQHLSFGTPEELSQVTPASFSRFSSW